MQKKNHSSLNTLLEKIKTLAAETANQLQQQHLTLATAESCTGGGLSYWLTSIPGSSSWFERGYVTYTNAAKIDMLEVNPLTLQEFGAVSKQTVCEMAENAKRKSRTHIAIAITGIAGPSRGIESQPVGTVWIAWAVRDAAPVSEMMIFTGDRQHIRLASIEKALAKLLEMLS